MSSRILWIDDEPKQTKAVQMLLEEEGFLLKRCATTSEAVRCYNFDHYDLILLDRMMNPNDVFGTDDAPMVDTGYKVYRDLRERAHLQNVPLIIYTQYYEKDFAQLVEGGDKRAKVIPKEVVGTELVPILRQMISAFPLVVVVPEVPDREHPNVAPYYAFHEATRAYLRLHFERCDRRQGEQWLKEHEKDGWIWGANFAGYLANMSMSRNVLMAVPEQAMDNRPTGLYFTGESATPNYWYRDVLFETSPWNRRGGESRIWRGIGKVLTVRFLRDCIYRSGFVEDRITMNMERLNDTDTLLAYSKSSRPFLESLGFQVSPKNPREMFIGHDAARRLINDVTQKPDSSSSTPT